MYTPKHFEEKDSEQIRQVILDNSFGLLVTTSEGRPLCSHIPFLYEPGRLLCHLARPNPQVAQLESGSEVLVVFSGPHAYISPSWYESPGVPTWNYIAVHIYGRARTYRDENRLRNLVDRMSTHFETAEPEPWGPQYDSAKLRGIVGVEIEIAETQAKFKLNQNRSVADQANVISKLNAKGTDLSIGTARYMQDREHE